ncbi:5-methylcytosine-specific restriction enzyme subunit McrC [Paraburkholderia sp. Clong3]|uniref:5-methylcytosine-specific restriction endonuclease system specificity protein McrC n=1 Tax=Paraburkholderia sp. Clong3 TaxID=2991061 RepID=UPI003D197927
MSKPIPIKNIWFLLSYAHGLARFSEQMAVEIAEHDNVPELLARLLATMVERRMKRNLARAYLPREARLTRVRGRIDLMATLSSGELRQGRVICRFDESSADTPRNQLFRFALMRLASLVRDEKLAHRCRLLGSELGRLGVTFRRPVRSETAREQMGRNDADDAALIVVANLALDPRLPTEDAGDVRLARVQRDENMLRKLFEKAVAGFYKRELPKRQWDVRSQKELVWPVEASTDGLLKWLPTMNADLIIDNRLATRRIVIDTKYTDIFTRNQFGQTRFKSEYVYQIFAYLRSQAGQGDQRADHAEGWLLHPAIGGQHVDESFTVGGHRIRFVTVNLADENARIQEALQLLIAAPPVLSG